MKHGGGLFNSVKGAVGSAAGSAGVSIPSVSELAQKVTDAVMKPGSPLAQAASVATSLPGKLTEVIDSVEEAPTVIAQAAADKATEAIDARLAEVDLTPPPPAPSNTSGTQYTDSYGEPSENDPGSEYYNNASSGGGGYETVHLSKPPKDPLHVFYLDGRPIYFTDNGKGRVKILPMHVDMQMATTSSRHKYTKKIRHKRKTRSTKKSRSKGVRKTSRKAKQHHSRRR